MKAYSYENDINFYDYIVFADNPEEAKAMVAVAEGWNADETIDLEKLANGVWIRKVENDD
jgi:hypothetical protein|nr:MAG TPA_asm: hypothetical protein [Caudoviricetes sp.]